MPRTVNGNHGNFPAPALLPYRDRRRLFMSVGDAVRSKINTVELALKETDTENAVKAIVDALKEIAKALDAVERQSAAAKAGR